MTGTAKAVLTVAIVALSATLAAVMVVAYRTGAATVPSSQSPLVASYERLSGLDLPPKEEQALYSMAVQVCEMHDSGMDTWPIGQLLMSNGLTRQQSIDIIALAHVHLCPEFG